MKLEICLWTEPQCCPLAPENGLSQSQGHQTRRPLLWVIGLTWFACQKCPVPRDNPTNCPGIAAWAGLKIKSQWSISRPRLSGGRVFPHGGHLGAERPGLGLTRWAPLSQWLFPLHQHKLYCHYSPCEGIAFKHSLHAGKQKLHIPFDFFVTQLVLSCSLWFPRHHFFCLFCFYIWGRIHTVTHIHLKSTNGWYLVDISVPAYWLRH